MRELTGDTLTERAKTSTAPINILKIEWGGEVGTKWYSDRVLASPVVTEARVVDWASIDSRLQEDRPVAPVSDLHVTLSDTDHVIQGYLDEVDVERTRVILYQHFEGLVLTDMVPLMVGMIDSPVRWSEDRQECGIDITDVAATNEQTIGNLATRAVFNKVAESDEGVVLPIVYGRVMRSKCVHVLAGAKTRLVRGMTTTDTTFYVEDGALFPQGTPIVIRIGYEEMLGSMNGNVFSITERQRIIVESLTTGLAPSILHVVCNNLGFANEALTGRWIQVYVTGVPPIVSGWETRLILSYNSSNGWIRINWPFQHQVGMFWTVPSNVPIKIRSPLQAHDIGDEVLEVVDKYVWIVSDRPSKTVRLVEGWGLLKEEQATGTGAVYSERETFVPLDPLFYTVDHNDTTTFPGLGRAVTTISMVMAPSEIPDQYFRRDDLWADVSGVDEWGDGSGSVLENPVDILEDLIETELGLTLGTDTDAASFASVKASASMLKMGFTFRHQRNVIEVLGDLCFQGRMVLRWEAGVAKLIWLENKAGSSVATIDVNEYELDSLALGRGAYENLATEITAGWEQRSEVKSVTVTNATAEVEFGRRVREINLWAYHDEVFVDHIANFWLDRMSRVYDTISLTTFLTTLEVERGDWVTFDIPTYVANAQRGQIIHVLHVPGSGRDQKPDRIELTARLPVAGGCATTCEMTCEMGSCESNCEWFCQSDCQTSCESNDCESDACMVGCQVYCTLECQATCQSTCQLVCQVSCTVGCQMPCQLGCETGCETSCEDPCETEGCQEGNCETTCESDACEFECQEGCTAVCTASCTADCQLASQGECGYSCETVCTTDCQTPCQASCQSIACQWSCQSECVMDCQDLCQTTEESDCSEACMVSCQGGMGACQSSCQSACEDMMCETLCTTDCMLEGCETTCQTGCTWWCESGCESGACETTCESDCMLFCQTSCTSDCESVCETGCETACQSECETGCETGCETSCEDACELECMSACETSCQDTCQLQCQTGCESSCEIECETGCQDGCQTSCQAGCQVDCQTGCETSCESGCQTGCETGCEIGCTFACQSACQAACMTSCQGECQLACQTGCQIDCQTGCETDCEGTTCETGCESACQGGACETGCQGWCQCWCQTRCESECQTMCTADCQFECQGEPEEGCTFACEIACQEGEQKWCQDTCETSCQQECVLDCQFVCEWTCQTPCQHSGEQGMCNPSCQAMCELETEWGGPCGSVACEVICEMDCQDCCQVKGCQYPCEHGCMEDCQGHACTSQCQLGCEAQCEFDFCETNCEFLCQDNCQSGCEASACQTNCEAWCQTACEGACEIHCQEPCESGCEGGCDGTCEVWCETEGCEGGCQVTCQWGCQLECQELQEWGG